MTSAALCVRFSSFYSFTTRLFSFFFYLYRGCVMWFICIFLSRCRFVCVLAADQLVFMCIRIDWKLSIHSVILLILASMITCTSGLNGKEIHEFKIFCKILTHLDEICRPTVWLVGANTAQGANVTILDDEYANWRQRINV